MSTENDPMVHYLAGWLLGVLDREAPHAMKITQVEPTGLDGFEVRLESGRVLRVSISCVQGPKEGFT